MSATAVREVRIRAWFREDLDAAREMLADVMADMRRRADIVRLVPDIDPAGEFDPVEVLVDEGHVLLADDECRRVCETVALIGARVGVSLWVNPEEAHVPDYIPAARLGLSTVLRNAIGVTRYGSRVRPGRSLPDLDDVSLDDEDEPGP